MTTIVNTPRGESTDSSLGLILGVIIAIALVVLFFVYGLPALRQGQSQPNGGNTDINVTLPGGGTGSGGSSGGSAGGTGGTGSQAY